MSQKILVTGGAGYIGSHACKALDKAGFVPVVYDNLSTGWRDAVKFGPFEKGDLLDNARLAEVFETHKPIAVMHFGALSNVGESVKEPELYHRNNVHGSQTLLAEMKKAGCNQIVFSSTCATYGEQDGVTLDEQCAQDPINPYGSSKLDIEKSIRADNPDLRSVIFRYFNVAGADPDANVGEFHRPETHLIPLVLDAIIGRRAALTIFGEDYPTADGTAVRDYVHVTDLVDAHILGLKWLLDGKDSEIFNLGTGHGFSVKEVITSAQETVNKPVPHEIGPRREGDCSVLVSGSTKAEQILGWKPKRSDMATMIKDAWRWHQIGDYKN